MRSVCGGVSWSLHHHIQTERGDRAQSTERDERLQFEHVRKRILSAVIGLVESTGKRKWPVCQRRWPQSYGWRRPTRIWYRSEHNQPTNQPTRVEILTTWGACRLISSSSMRTAITYAWNSISRPSIQVISAHVVKSPALLVQISCLSGHLVVILNN